jgi:hypothetical protein
MAQETNFDGQFGGLGIATAVADSGDTTPPGTSVTATFGQMGGQQPQVMRGKLYLGIKNTTGSVGQIDFYATDGTNQEWLGGVPAPATASAGRGTNLVLEWFCALAKVTNVVSVVANIGGSLSDGTVRLRVLGGH